MGRTLATLASALLMLCVVPARAADAVPRVLFPAGQTLPVEAESVVTVEGALMQVELRQGLILSAQRGTQFSIAKAGLVSNAMQLNVLRGTLTLADIQTNAVTRLPLGSYAISPTGISVHPGDASPNRNDATGAETETLAPGYRLSDAVMTQQQKYLDSLKVDVRDINHILASIIRGLVPRR